MRALWFPVLVAAVVPWTACSPSRRAPASQFNVADRLHEWQLVRGFYPVETAPNRWAAREFSVVLRPPPGGAAGGAMLWLRFFLPGEQIEQLGPVTLYADVDGYRVEPQTFSEGGFHDFTRQVPGCLLDANIVPVRFVLDKAVEPASGDGRELGAVVSDVGLRPR